MASLTQPFFPVVACVPHTLVPTGRIALSLADCQPAAVVPGLSRLFTDFCASSADARPFYGFAPFDPGWQLRPALPAHWSSIVDILAAQNPTATASMDALRAGAGTVLTGQQVGLFGGPLYSPFKAATALGRARRATQSGRPHVGIFWLASEDHDFAEINHVVFPARRELRKLVYTQSPAAPVPAGSVVIDDSIKPLLEQAWELLGFSDAMQALEAAWQPGRTFAQAFADFYSKVFAAQGLLVFDAASREVHALGAPVLQAAIERADEFHAALEERNRALVAAGFHAQVAVAPGSSLLFLIDAKTGARVALKRQTASVSEPGGLWQAGRDRYTSADLTGILAAEPERISPAALLRPIFQDFLFSTSLTIGGPAEIAYFAQSAPLFQKILGRQTYAEPRFSTTLIEPAIGDLLKKHELTLERIFTGSADSLAQLLAARSMPVEGKRKLSAAGNALDAELTPLLEWMHMLDQGLGRSADTAASKMRYQMNRLRRLAANFQLQREESLQRHAQAISTALCPGGILQERVHGAAFYFARYSLDLAERLTAQAADSSCTSHTALWL
jgi:bacillithiol synthase